MLDDKPANAEHEGNAAENKVDPTSKGISLTFVFDL